MAALSLFLTAWPTDLWRRRWRPERGEAVILARVEHQREIVAARCALARRAGVEIGMSVAHARAIVGAVRMGAYDEAGDARALRRLAERATRFTPRVAADPPDGLLLDGRGCARLYGDVGVMAERVRRWVEWMGFSARVALAPTFGAAWAWARFGEPGRTEVRAHELERVMAGLPVRALRADAQAEERLREVGVERVGELMALPREEVASRCGEGVLLGLDRALGRGMETIEPARPSAPVCAERVLDGPTDRIEAVEACAREVIGLVVEQLCARESGCRGVVVTLERSDLPVLRLEARASVATRDAGHWWSLLREPVANAHLGFGVEAVRARASGLERLAHAQVTNAAEAVRAADAGRVARLVDVMAARLGEKCVVRAEVVESHVPERAWRVRAWEGGRRGRAAGVTGWDRPLAVRDAPTPIEVVLLMPEGPVMVVRLGGRSWRVLRCDGPERIGGEWWREGGDGGRDYYALTLEDGRRVWVFRETEVGRWFWQGEWA